MRLRFSCLTIKSLVVCFTLIAIQVSTSLGQHDDLPSGLPKNLSDNSSYEPCLGTFCGMSPPRSPWYVQEEAIFLKRDRVDSVALQTLGNLGDVVLSTDQLNSPFRAGGRIVLGHTFGDSRWQLDGTYFALDSWNDTTSIRDTSFNELGGQGNMFSPFSNFGYPPTLGFDYNDFLSVREVSQLQNGELNIRYLMPMPHECLTAKFIIGLRYMSINEQFDYHATSTSTGSASYVSTLAKNDLIGPQLGGDMYFYIYPRCWINFEFKGAVCNNRAVQHTVGTRAIGATSTNFDNYDTTDITAFVGDLNLSLVWQLTQRLTTRIGYQAIWVNDIAMGARNFAPSASLLMNGPPVIDTAGRSVYHGPHIGLEFNW
jgi:hypothetical protein